MIPREVLSKVRRIEIVTNRLVSEVMAGSYHSVFRGRGMEFDEVREYAPGDDVRAIDWNVTARTGAPHVKTYVEERELTVMLMVDLSGSTDFGSVEHLKSEIAAEVCALLAFSAIRNNDRVERYIPPKKGKNHVLRVVREVLFFRPTWRGTSLPAAAEHALRLLKRRSVVFLISDFIAPDLKRPLSLLNQRHDLIALRLTDPREMEIPAVGIVPFEDPETGETHYIDTNSARFRRAYAQEAGRWRDSTTQLLRRLRVDHADIATDRPYLDPIVEIFRRRALRY
jgi:uncharacterized protein (DUF58 family)